MKKAKKTEEFVTLAGRWQLFRDSHTGKYIIYCLHTKNWSMEIPEIPEDYELRLEYSADDCNALCSCVDMVDWMEKKHGQPVERAPTIPVAKKRKGGAA